MAGNDGEGKALVSARTYGRTVRGSGINRFDSTQANDARTTQLLAALASAAGDHTKDMLARRMIQNAVAELFDATHRLERLEACGRSDQAMLGALMAESHSSNTNAGTVR